MACVRPYFSLVTALGLSASATVTGPCYRLSPHASGLPPRVWLIPRCSDVQAVRRYRMHLPGMLGVLVFTDVEPS